MNVNVKWTVPVTSLGLYGTIDKTCIIVNIHTNDVIKEVYAVTYIREWMEKCGCGQRYRRDITHSGQFTDEVREMILKKLPDYTIQKLKWS